MAIEFKRIVTKISNTASVVPTIPTTNDHSDGSWLSTDIYKGELFFNSEDATLYTRDENDNIVTLNGSAGSGDLDGVETIELDRTFILTDSNKIIRLNGSADRVWTVPPNSSVAFPIGTQILLERINTAELDVVAGAGVTVNSADGFLSLNKRYSGAVLVKTNTDTWELFGDLKA